MRYTKPYGKENKHLSGKYQAQSMISYLHAVGDSEGNGEEAADF